MSRATSASVYGSGTPTDLSRVPWTRPVRAYGLRSQSSVAGYYPAYGNRPRRITRKDIVDRATNLVAPVVEDDGPVRTFVRTDFDAERRIAASINMVEAYN